MAVTLAALVLAAPLVAAPFVGGGAQATGSPGAISQADLDRLEARAQALTATAETARTAVVETAAAALDMRLQLDELANKRDAEQAKVDAALVELYEQSVQQTGVDSIGPRFADLHPTIPNMYGGAVAQQQSTVDTLDAHAATLAQLSETTQRYSDLLRTKAAKVYAAEDEALTLLATLQAEYERQQRAADVARVQAESKRLRDISNQVSNAVSPGVGRRGQVALGQQAAIIELLTAAGSGYPAGYGPTGQTFDGTSSWYGPGFEGKPTATGAPFDPEKLTAAMKAVPLGTVIHVTFGTRAVNLLVNDRGPYVGDRIIDCSRAGSRALGFDGLANVHIEVLGPLTP
ncbi:MAG: rare lipoprotein [Frankiaceae bacterium]|nr:rare lipoprotein [Frankiaceae bacterium]